MADWSPVSDPLPGAQLDRLVQYVREQSPHEQLVTIWSLPVQASASRAAVAAGVFGAFRQVQSEEGRIDAAAPTQRSIAGRSHPVMTFRLVHDDGVFVRDGLYLIYFSDDFEQRQRVHVLSWFDNHSSDVAASALDDFDAIVASLEVMAVGSPLQSDDFSVVSPGTFSPGSTRPERYVDGEYVLSNTETASGFTVVTERRFVDSSVAFDARFTSDTPNQNVQIVCRRNLTNGTMNGYYVRLFPFSGRVDVTRRDSDKTTVLASRQSPVNQLGETPVHLELICSGGSIIASVNGTRVVRVEDDTFTEGTMGLGIVAPLGSVAEARFDNFVITQR